MLRSQTPKLRHYPCSWLIPSATGLSEKAGENDGKLGLQAWVELQLWGARVRFQNAFAGSVDSLAAEA